MQLILETSRSQHPRQPDQSAVQWLCEIVCCISCVVSPGRAERGNCLLLLLPFSWEVALRWNQHFKALYLHTLVYEASVCVDAVLLD